MQRRSGGWRRWLGAVLIGGAALPWSAIGMPATAADAAPPTFAESQQRRFSRGGGAALIRVQLAVNKSETVRLDYAFNDVLVGSPEILDVIPLNERTVYVLGKKVGTTNISVLDAAKRLVAVIDVEVGLDSRNVEAKVQAGTGSSAIRVRSQGDKLVLSGTAADAPTVDRAVSIASALAPGGVINATRVASPQQVLLKVRFVEVNRNAGRELGLRFEYAGRNRAARVGNAGPNAPLTTTGVPSITAQRRGVGVLTDIVPSVASATLGGAPFAQILSHFGSGSRQLDVIISALEERGLARRLAEPNLVAMSGDAADFLAGGEYPVPIAGSTQGGVPTVTVAFKEFGVRLSFTPTVLANGVINLRLEPEVSEIDASISVNTGVVTVPGLSKRRARTSVELRDGQSFAVAGLLQANSQTNIEQFPWLGSIPVLGALFRSTEFQQRETELVVIVTPHLVKPGKPGAIIETPLDTTVPANDLDLFLAGKLEIEKPGRAPIADFVAARGAKVGPYGHIVVKAPDAAAEQPVVVRARN